MTWSPEKGSLGAYLLVTLRSTSEPKLTALFVRGFPTTAKTRGEEFVKNIYVGNLSFRTTEEEVRSLFEAYGQVDRVNVVRDRDTGQPRGFAFVEMSNDEEAEKAIAEINGRAVGGRALNVNEARPKTERPAGERGGRGGGRFGDRDRGGRGQRW